LRNIDADKAVGSRLGTHHPASSMRACAQTSCHRMSASATRSLTALQTWNHSGYRPGSVCQGSSTNQAMPR
jgi:hypothetical protein